MLSLKNIKKIDTFKDFDDFNYICTEELVGYVWSSESGHYCGLENRKRSSYIPYKGGPIIERRTPLPQDIFPIAEKSEKNRFPIYYGYTAIKYLPYDEKYLQIPISRQSYDDWMQNCKSDPSKCDCSVDNDSEICEIA